MPWWHVADDASHAELFFRRLVESDARLGELCDATDLDVVSLAVNGERVDVVARAGEREWRVVFGTSDGAIADWLHVYERPRDFSGVVGGRVVIINGPSSSGKSTVLHAIRSVSAVPWVVFDELMFGTVDAEYLIWRNAAAVLHQGFVDGIAALARAGNFVAVAAGGHPARMFTAAFEGVPTVRIGLDCDPDELERRERQRSDVPGGNAQAAPEIHEGWHYDVRFDTTTTLPEEIAAATLQAVQNLRV